MTRVPEPHAPLYSRPLRALVWLAATGVAGLFWLGLFVLVFPA